MCKERLTGNDEVKNTSCPPLRSNPDLIANNGLMLRVSLIHYLKKYRNYYGERAFSPNHLRHTISTRMRGIGIRPDIVERVIGHSVDSGIMGMCSSYNWLVDIGEMSGMDSRLSSILNGCALIY